MVDRILIGKRPSDGVVGMWISKPTKDISSTNPDDFLFDPSKYLARAYMRLSPVSYTEGAFYRTVTYADGTKSDDYFRECLMPLPFGYVPLVIAQIEPNLPIMADGVSYTASAIRIKLNASSAFRYAAGDASKTPIAGSIVSGYNVTTHVYTPTTPTKTTFIVYRNPLF
jgi:hypothetical protein